MGIDNRRLYGLAMALSLGIVAVAGVFLGIRTTFTFASGPDRLLFAFEAVIIGGLGSLWGTLVGGAVLGVAQTVGAKLSPGWGILTGHLVFLAVLLLRPQGLFAKARRVACTTRASRAGLVAAALVLVALVGLPAWGSASTMRVLVEFIALLGLAQMWNLLAGYAGLVSIGQQAYVGLGGYALIVLADDLGANPFLAVPLAGLVTAALALPTAALVFRFRGGYFAVGTWAIAEVCRLLIANAPALGRGSGRTLKAVFPLARESREVTTYLLALAIGVATLIAVYLVLRSRYGLGLMAIRDSEPGSETLGIDVFRTKVAVYVGVGFGTGVTGALIYLNLLRISPDAAFSINWTAYPIFIVVIGGLGTLEGPLVGTALFFLVREGLSDYGAWYMILLGTLAVGVMLVYPRGLWGLVASRWDVHFFPVQRRVRPGGGASDG
jgi:branched-chain amino acid transport system permease protein